MKQDVPLVFAAFSVLIIAAIWLAHARSNAVSDHKTSYIPVTQSPLILVPATPQTPSTPPAVTVQPRRTVMSSPYNVPNSSSPRGATGESAATHDTQPTGTPNDQTHPRTDAEALNKAVSPTGNQDDEFSRTKVMHNRLVTEPRDDSWASQAEEQLRNYLTANMGTDRVNLVSVQCASSVCEIQAATTVPGKVGVDLEEWQNLIFTMAQQPWWAEYQFSEPSNRVQATPDHQRALFIAFITRIPAQS